MAARPFGLSIRDVEVEVLAVRPVCLRAVARMQWGEVERLEKHLSGVDVLLTNSEEQRIVVGLALNLVAALGPHVDGADPHERERPVTELWMT
nr:hypothetical protein [Halostagnicola sp. A56]